MDCRFGIARDLARMAMAANEELMIKNENFIKHEMERLKLDGYSAQDLVDHGYYLEVLLSTGEARALKHNPAMDKTLQLMDC